MGVISRSRRLRLVWLVTLTETLIILDITKTESDNCFIIYRTKQLKSCFCFSLTASNTKRANLTWLPLEIMHAVFFHQTYRLSDNNNKKNGALRSQTIFGFFISVPDYLRLGWRTVSSRMYPNRCGHLELLFRLLIGSSVLKNTYVANLVTWINSGSLIGRERD